MKIVRKLIATSIIAKTATLALERRESFFAKKEFFLTALFPKAAIQLQDACSDLFTSKLEFSPNQLQAELSDCERQWFKNRKP